MTKLRVRLLRCLIEHRIVHPLTCPKCFFGRLLFSLDTDMENNSYETEYQCPVCGYFEHKGGRIRKEVKGVAKVRLTITEANLVKEMLDKCICGAIKHTELLAEKGNKGIAMSSDGSKYVEIEVRTTSDEGG